MRDGEKVKEEDGKRGGRGKRRRTGDRKKQPQEAGGGSGSRPLMGAGAHSTWHTWGGPGGCGWWRC